MRVQKSLGRLRLSHQAAKEAGLVGDMKVDNCNTRWTDEDKQKLHELVLRNYSNKGIASILGRTEAAVRNGIRTKIWRTKE